MNSKTFVWEIINSPYSSQFLQKSKTFGRTNPIFLIDQYSGKRPQIINQEYKRNGTIDISMYPSALLDSNVVNLLDSFIQKGKATDGFSEFLRFLITEGWDFNLMFYYFEHFAKSPLEIFKSNAIRRTDSLLKLHTMNEEHFLKTGEVISNLEEVEHYTSSSGVNSLLEVAESRVDDFIHDYKNHPLSEMLEATEIALIKMVLIRKNELIKSSPVEQYNEFNTFLQNDLGIILGREAHLALHYFCDNAGRLLGIQANTAYKKAISIIKSTAWDLFLLRMPEILFGESPKEVCVSYICTQEKQLQELAKLYDVERIESYSTVGILPSVSFNLSGIPKVVQSQLSIAPVKKPQDKKKTIPVGLYQVLCNELQRFCT